MLQFLKQMLRGQNRQTRGARRRASLQVEALQARMLPSVTAFVNPAHELVIRGDNAANHVDVSIVKSKVHVVADGKSLDFNTQAVHKIVFSGNAGNDVFTDHTAIPCVADGGAGNDQLTGGGSNDVLRGSLGNDVIHGGAGRDQIVGGAGNDKLFGDDGNDLVKGDAGDDMLSGGAGNDNLSGGAGNDDLSGDDGNDLLYGDSGNDHLSGGLGSDHMDGGAGTDVASGDASSTEVNCEQNDLAATLAGATSAVGQAEFSSAPHNGFNFQVEIEHAGAVQTYNVLVDGNQVGSLTTTKEGEGKLQLNLTSSTVQEGTVVTVKDLQGVTVMEGPFSKAF